MVLLNLENSLSNSIVKLFRRVNRAHNRQFAALSLTAEQVHLLSILWNKGSMTIGALQNHLNLSSGTIAGAIDRMEKKGLLRRVKSSKDKRITYIEIGNSINETTQNEINRILYNTEEELFEKLSTKEKQQLLLLLQKVFTD